MSYQHYILINKVLVYSAFSIWTLLAAVFILVLIKRNYNQLKLIILYFLNTLVFFAGIPFYVRLALIVRWASSEKTIEGAYRLFRQECLAEIGFYMLISTGIAIGFVAFNSLYQRLVFKQIDKRKLFVLFCVDLIALFILSIAAVANYYCAMLEEINHQY